MENLANQLLLQGTPLYRPQALLYSYAKVKSKGFLREQRQYLLRRDIAFRHHSNVRNGPKVANTPAKQTTDATSFFRLPT
jgi:hypothetical protein